MRTRWNSHRENLRKQRHHSRHLQRAWNKYGEQNFVHSVLRIFLDYDEGELLRCEQFYMDKFSAYEKGFNTSKIAGRSACPPGIISAGQKRVAHIHRAKAKSQWEDPEMRAKMLQGMRRANLERPKTKNPKQSEFMKRRWLENPESVLKGLRKAHSPEYRALHSDNMKQFWADPIRSATMREIRKTQKKRGKKNV